jgi:anti-sigma factor RsiW
MKPEMLETLLLDRALGELPPEVAALLDAHLAQTPDAAIRAAEFADTLQLARTAVAAPRETPRALDLERLRRAHRAQHSATRRSEILRLAACLALGLGLGWLARTPSPHTVIAAATPRPVPVVSVPTPPPAAAPTTRFWSVARLIAEERAQSATENRSDNRFELHWNSPTKQPRLEEKL